jgi:hypothetical protein
VLVYQPVAGHGQLPWLFTKYFGYFLDPDASRAAQGGHGRQVVALLGPQTCPGGFVLAPKFGAS